MLTTRLQSFQLSLQPPANSSDSDQTVRTWIQTQENKINQNIIKHLMLTGNAVIINIKYES